MPRKMPEIKELSPQELLRTCKPEDIHTPTPEIKTIARSPLFLGLGQDRLAHALEVGIREQDSTHNIFVTGLSGSAGFEILKKKIENLIESLTHFPDENKKNKKRHRADASGSNFALPALNDWCYVFNFESPRAPLPIPFTKGKGKEFKRGMMRLLMVLNREIPLALSSDVVEEQIFGIKREFTKWKEGEDRRLYKEGEALGYHIYWDGPEGDNFNFVPFGKELDSNGMKKPMSKTEHLKLSDEEISDMTQRELKLRSLFKPYRESMMQKAVWAAKETKKIIENTVRDIVESIFEATKIDPRVFGADSKFMSYWTALKEYSIQNYSIFGEEVESDPRAFKEIIGQGQLGRNPFLPWEVNVFIDHSETKSVPIIAEPVSSLADLCGFIDLVHAVGVSFTDHTRIVSGLVGEANGGYWILDAGDFRMIPYGWQVLKRIIKSRTLAIETPYSLMGYELPIQPIPIPANIRVILFGDSGLLEWLSHEDPDFNDLFKIRADVKPFVEYSPEQVGAFGDWIDWFTNEEKIISPLKDAVGAIIEHAGRLADHQERLSTDFGALETTIKQAALIARTENADKITRAHVGRALKENFWRSNLPYEYLQEAVKEGTILVLVSGEEIGQINGLYVMARGTISFGSPARITSQVNLGKPEFNNIQYNSGLGGKILGKGGETVIALYKGRYVQDIPDAIEKYISFEQTYNIVDGDSASLAQYVCLLSKIAEVPIQQSIAVTGSLDMHGRVQPIGGVNEKIEGFFDACRVCGELTGEQGVVIPVQNKKHLMLRDDVVKAVNERKFHVWSVETPDEAIKILTGMDPKKFDAKVKKRVRQFANRARVFMKSGGSR